MTSLVDRLHHPRPATGDDREAAVCKSRPKLHAHRVVGVVGSRARRTEHRDCRPDAIECVTPLHDLRQDAQHSPRVGVVAQLFDRAALEQRFVGRRLKPRNDKTAGAATIRHGAAYAPGSGLAAAAVAEEASPLTPLIGSEATVSLTRLRRSPGTFRAGGSAFDAIVTGSGEISTAGSW